MPGKAPEPSRSRVDDDGRDITFHGNKIRSLGFSLEEVFMGEGATSVESCGPHTTWRHAGGTRATTWCGGSVALLRLSFGLRVVSGKIGTWQFVSSNSENISLITFLKPKTAENRQLALWHLVNSLVS